MRVFQQVIIGAFFEQCAGVDELGGGVLFVFGQYQNIYSDGGTEKQIRCQRDHRFHIVVVH